jgi:hypothetical protein
MSDLVKVAPAITLALTWAQPGNGSRSKTLVNTRHQPKPFVIFGMATFGR